MGIPTQYSTIVSTLPGGEEERRAVQLILDAIQASAGTTGGSVSLQGSNSANAVEVFTAPNLIAGLVAGPNCIITADTANNAIIIDAFGANTNGYQQQLIQSLQPGSSPIFDGTRTLYSINSSDVIQITQNDPLHLLTIGTVVANTRIPYGSAAAKLTTNAGFFYDGVDLYVNNARAVLNATSWSAVNYANYANVANTANFVATANAANFANYSNYAGIASNANYATVAGSADASNSSNFANQANYAPWANVQNKPNVSYNLTGDATGSAAAVLGDTVNIGVTVVGGHANVADVANAVTWSNVGSKPTPNIAITGDATGSNVTTVGSDVTINLAVAQSNAANFANSANFANQANYAPWANVQNKPTVNYYMTGNVTGQANPAVLGSDVSFTNVNCSYATVAGTAQDAVNCNLANYVKADVGQFIIGNANGIGGGTLDVSYSNNALHSNGTSVMLATGSTSWWGVNRPNVITIGEAATAVASSYPILVGFNCSINGAALERPMLVGSNIKFEPNTGYTKAIGSNLIQGQLISYLVNNANGTNVASYQPARGTLLIGDNVNSFARGSIIIHSAGSSAGEIYQSKSTIYASDSIAIGQNIYMGGRATNIVNANVSNNYPSLISYGVGIGYGVNVPSFGVAIGTSVSGRVAIGYQAAGFVALGSNVGGGVAIGSNISNGGTALGDNITTSNSSSATVTIGTDIVATNVIVPVQLIGTNINNPFEGGIAIGTDLYVTGGIAIGGSRANLVTSSLGGIAIGFGANARAANATAIGINAAGGSNGVVVGWNVVGGAAEPVVYGSNSRAAAYSLAIGRQVNADSVGGNGTITAIGHTVNVVTWDTTAIGRSLDAAGNAGSVVVGAFGSVAAGAARGLYFGTGVNDASKSIGWSVTRYSDSRYDMNMTGDINAVTTKFTETNNGSGGANKTIDWGTSDTQMLTLTANCNVTFTNAQCTTKLLRVVHDASTNYSVTFANVYLSGTNGKSSPVVNCPGGANLMTIFSIYYSGADYFVSSIPFWGA